MQARVYRLLNLIYQAHNHNHSISNGYYLTNFLAIIHLSSQSNRDIGKNYLCYILHSILARHYLQERRSLTIKRLINQLLLSFKRSINNRVMFINSSYLSKNLNLLQNDLTLKGIV